MGFLEFLRGDRFLEDAYSTSADEQRALPRPDNELPLAGIAAPYMRSQLHGEQRLMTAQQALAVNDVWSCVRVLSDAASSLPLHAYRKTDRGRERVTSGRLADLLDQPAPATSQADLVATIMLHLVVHGAGYVGKYRQAGEIVQLGAIHPDKIRPELEGGVLRFRYTPGTGGQQLLTTADVTYIRGMSDDGLTGMSPIRQAARVIGLSDELVRHALEYFASDQPHPAGVLKLGDAGLGLGGELGDDRDKEAIRAEARPHGLLVVQGDVEYTAIAQALDDAQFVEQRRLVAQEVARAFRVPPNMIGAGSGAGSLTYSTVEQQSLDFVRYSLTPWLRRVELAVSGDRDLTFDRQYVQFSIDALLRPDSAGRAAFYREALDPVHGWLTRAEVRELEDMPPEPEPSPAAVMAQAINSVMEASTNGNS